MNTLIWPFLALPTLVPRIESESEVMTPQVGSSLILRCEAKGVPEPEVTWYRNGLQLAAGNGLRIEHQQLEIIGVQVRNITVLMVFLIK